MQTKYVLLKTCSSPCFYLITMFLVMIFAVFPLVSALAQDADLDGIDDAYELLFGLDASDPVDAGYDYDEDSLVNLAEFYLYTDPFQPDTDGDGFADNVDAQALSRVNLNLGILDFVNGDAFYYPGPLWWLGAIKVGGTWQEQGWTVLPGNSSGQLSLNLDRTSLTNNLWLKTEVQGGVDSELYIDILDDQGAIILHAVNGNLIDQENDPCLIVLELPLEENADGSIIQLRRQAGAITIAGCMLYIDQDGDGLDDDQESQIGSNPLNIDDPLRVPGCIEAEDYDDGGEGIAYHDTTSGNSGGQYKSENVDIEATSDAGGGYNVGWAKAGEWLLYTINAQQDGTYTLVVRVANNESAGSIFHLEIDGIDISGPLVMPATGGWQNWQNVTVEEVSLTEGLHELRLVLDTQVGTSYLGNYNYIDFVFQETTINTAPIVDAGADQTLVLPDTVILNGVATDDGLPAASLTITWSQVSGPGVVTFADEHTENTTAAFSIDGSYVLRLTADDGDLVSYDEMSVTVEPVPATGTVVNGLSGAYYDGIELTDLKYTQINSRINFEWGSGTPDAALLGVDYFSIRWTGEVEADYSETYTFTTRTDDGVRLWVNDVLIINRWIDQAPAEHTGSIDLLAGQRYSIKMEFYEKGGGAVAQLSWQSASLAKELIPSDHLFTVTEEPPVNIAPVVDAGADQTLVLPDAVTLNGVATDDGLPAATLTVTWSQVSGPGVVTFADEHAKNTTAAFSIDGLYVLRLTANDGDLVSYDEMSVTVEPAPATGTVVNGLSGTYYDGIDLTDLKYTQINSRINFEWGSGSPNTELLGIDYFSIRWTGEVEADYSETYSFTTRTDDGVRLWVNDVLIINRWIDQAPAEHTGSIDLLAGQRYSIKMEFYEKGGGAVAQLSWQSASLAKELIPSDHLFTMTEEPPVNIAPVVDAGADQTLVLPDTVTLNGVATDDGLSTEPLTVTWSQVSGPGVVTFADEHAENTTAAFSIDGLYVLRLTADDGDLVSSDDMAVTVSPASVTGTGILREWWSNIGSGNAISDLTGSVNYPDAPDGSEIVTTVFEGPVNWADQYGTRMRGYFLPPQSGTYIFWLATDDNGELWLSTDDDPANATRIAYISSWAGSRNWNKYASQQSAGISLVAGQRYYIEALQKEGGGGDNIAVAVERPDGTFDGPISCTYLAPWLADTNEISDAPFLQYTDGTVTIEAEHFHSRTVQNGHEWSINTASGYAGDSAMEATPNSGVLQNTDYVANSPVLNYEIQFVTPGTHYVWIRGIGASGTDDSCHAGLDGQAFSSSDRISSFNTGWTWSRATMDGVNATINIPAAGLHALNIWMREDGFVIDKILLTTDSSFVPTGLGPTENPRVDQGTDQDGDGIPDADDPRPDIPNEAPVVTLGPTQSIANFHDEGGISLTVSATDADGDTGITYEFAIDGGAWESAASATLTLSSFDISAGPLTLSARAIDDWGAIGLSQSVTVQIFRTPPRP